MILNSIYITYLKAIGINASYLSYVENRKNVKIGRGTIIDPLSVIKGGKKAGDIVSIGKASRIRRNCYISASEGTIQIGDNVLVAHNSWIAGRGVIEIGENTLIGPNVVIVSSNHDLSKSEQPTMFVPEIPGIINIGSKCWIGANSTIVPNVNIGTNCIIAAGSVVTKDIPNNTLVAGNPAKSIREVSTSEELQPYKD